MEITPNPPMESFIRNVSTPLLATLVVLPILAMFAAWLLPAGDGFAYLMKHDLLIDYSINSLTIALLTGGFSLIIGISLAWAVTMWDFPGKQTLSWILILPFAMPGYVAAMIYAYLLEGAGPIQLSLRELTGMGFHDYWFPNIRSLGGVVFILTITLYPYIYLMARTAFLTQSRQIMETGVVLGLSRKQLFYKLALPMARPALITGLALVMMEALADFGVVSLFGVTAFTTGIYRIWQGFYDPIAAARLAGLLLIFVLGLLWIERSSRRHARYDNTTGLYHPLTTHCFSGLSGWGITLLCALPVLLGFFIPLGWILKFSALNYDVFADSMTWSAAFNSFQLSLLTAVIAGAVGLLFAYALRRKQTPVIQSLVRLAVSGYAIPGSVVAVGVLLFLITLQNEVFAGQIFLTGTMLGILWGCVLRFLTISFNSCESGLERITPAMDAVATTLGAGRWRILTAVHLPILKASLISGLLLVFVDTLKELPATLLLRPFNFNTLAIRTYELASDDLLPHATPTALLLVALSLYPVWLLNKKLSTSRPGDNHA